MHDFTKKENLTYETRIGLVQANFCKQMGLLYQPHTHLKEGDAAAVYMREIGEAINSRLSSHIPNSESYKDVLRQIWRQVTGKHRSRFWFSLADVISATNQANRAWEAKHAPKKKAQTFGGQAGENETRKKGEGWTLEGARRELAKTDAMIASGELSRGMGEILRRIPLKAIERLTGEAQNIAPPPVQETPKEHLPDDSGKLDLDLIKKGMTKPEFDPFDLAHDDLPDNLKASPPSFDSL